MTEPPVFENFADLMHLEPHGADVYVGLSPEYPWGRVYGGQVVAQALQAAIHTTDEGFEVHSIHGYFIRGGTSTEPIRFEVDRIRNGRSFCTRRVVARQSNGAILNLSASFHVVEDGPDAQRAQLPDGVPMPDELEGEDWSPLMERRSVPSGALGDRHGVWLRLTSDLADTPGIHEVGLLYASDDVPFDAAARMHPERTGEWDGTGEPDFVGASLDHAVWFHRTGRADQWQLHVLDGLTHVGNRGLAFGQIFAEDGTHLASVAQEIVHRQNTRRS